MKQPKPIPQTTRRSVSAPAGQREPSALPIERTRTPMGGAGSKRKRTS